MGLIVWVFNICYSVLSILDPVLKFVQKVGVGRDQLVVRTAIWMEVSRVGMTWRRSCQSRCTMKMTRVEMTRGRLIVVTVDVVLASFGNPEKDWFYYWC